MDGERRPQRDLVVAFGGDFQAMSHEPPHSVPIEAELDLHTFAPRDIRSVVTEYVHAASAAGLQEVRFVHGRGTGVQRGNVQSTLEQHPLVTAFWDDPRSHLGATIASIRPGAPDPA